MKNVLDESVQQEYDGEFYQIKIKYAFKYEYNNNDVIIYKLLIIPKYLTTTVVKGIQLHSIEYDSVLDYLYDEMNFAFSNLDASKHTYQKVDEFVGKYYEFALVNNSKIKGKELTDDQWESALTNISLTIKINRTNDIINMKDINIVPYDSSIHD